MSDLWISPYSPITGNESEMVVSFLYVTVPKVVATIFWCYTSIPTFLVAAASVPDDLSSIWSIIIVPFQDANCSNRDSPMPQRRTYGSKKSTTSSAASAIFGAATSHTARSVAGSVSRSVLSDITNRVASLALENDGGIIIDTSSSGSTQGAADLGEIHFSPEFRHPHPQPDLSGLPISPELPSQNQLTLTWYLLL